MHRKEEVMGSRNCRVKSLFLAIVCIAVFIYMHLKGEVWNANTQLPVLHSRNLTGKSSGWQHKTGKPASLTSIPDISRTLSRQYHTGHTTGSTSIIKTSSNLKRANDHSITLLVRMAGKLKEHRHRYYCDLFRTTVLYWPPSYGKTVVVLDEESELDHVFGEKIKAQTNDFFPEYKLEVLYETLPKDPRVLDFPGAPKPPGYNRQLWSSFFMDLYTNDSIIAWMDNDAAFITPVTKSSIFSGSKLRALGWDCSLGKKWVQAWAQTTELALGFPYVADFMTYFPVYIYRDTFIHCREHILKHFNTHTFSEAFKQFYRDFLSPVSIVMSYAWYFERDRYDWNMKICSDLNKYNKKFPVGHTIGIEHTESVLSEPQTTFHVPYAESLFSNVLVSYCLSHEASGKKMGVCSKHNFSLSDNFDLLQHDLQRIVSLPEHPCSGDKRNFCLQVLERHYKQVGAEIKENRRKVDWHNVETVERLANDVDIKCEAITFQR